MFFEKGEEAHKAGRDLTKLEKKAKPRSLDYLIILSDIYERITEEKAKVEIDNLRNVSRKFFGEHIWSIHEKRMEELREERRREEIKKEIKAPEEVSKIKTIDWNIYRNEKLGFEIRHPQDWIKKEVTDVVTFGSSEKDAVLYVAVLDISAHPITLDEYKQHLIDQCKMPDCDIIDSSDIMLANNPAYKAVYIMKGPPYDILALFMSISIIKGNKLYSLRYESVEYFKYLDIVNAMINSFQIIK